MTLPVVSLELETIPSPVQPSHCAPRYFMLFVVQVERVKATSGDFCHLLITFANTLEPDPAQQNLGSDLDSSC